MKTIDIKYTNASTSILIENNLLTKLNLFIEKDKRYFIITDETVYNLYKESLNIKNSIIKIIPEGEKEKNINTVLSIIESMLEANINRNDVIINFGGGVVSDIGGFIASVYKRGIEYYNIPTTLLAQVDAALGGKTAIDFSFDKHIYKNQIGTIHHPTKIFVDPQVLKTLRKEDYISGMGEVIKYGLCFDDKLFYSLFSELNLEEIIYKCLDIKAKITAIDEFDNNERLSLNYGHTIGHAVESLLDFKYPHGLCVTYGMILETKDIQIKEKLSELANHFGFVFDFEIEKSDLKKFILHDKKVKADFIKIPVLEKIGKVEIKKMKLSKYLGELL